MSFQERLREIREARGLSREELADLVELGRGAIRDYEQGRREPSLSNGVKLARALGIAVEEFFIEPPTVAPKKPAAKKPKGKTR